MIKIGEEKSSKTSDDSKRQKGREIRDRYIGYHLPKSHLKHESQTLFAGWVWDWWSEDTWAKWKVGGIF